MECTAGAEGITGMDGEKKVVLVSITLMILCVTILFSFLFIALWQYKVIVGVTLLVMLLTGSLSACIATIRSSTPTQVQHPGYAHVKQESAQTYDTINHPW